MRLRATWRRVTGSQEISSPRPRFGSQIPRGIRNVDSVGLRLPDGRPAQVVRDLGDGRLLVRRYRERNPRVESAVLAVVCLAAIGMSLGAIFGH